MSFIKNNIKFLIAMLIVIVLGVFGITYALKIATFNPIGINTTTGNITASITYDSTNTSTVTSNNKMLPIADTLVTGVDVTDERILKVKFMVTGSSSNPDNTIYDISLRNIDMSNALKSEYVKWRLYKNGTLLSEGNFSPAFDIKENNRLVLTNTQQDLTTNTDTYVYLMWISEACTGDLSTCDITKNQDKLLGKIFNAQIKLEASTKSKKTLTRTALSINSASMTITNMFTPNKLVENGNSKYRYDTTNNLMEDVDGNIRYYGKSNTTIVPAWQSDETVLAFATYDSEADCLEDFEISYNTCSPDVGGYENYGYSDQATCEAEYDWGSDMVGESMTYNEGKQKYCTGIVQHYEPVEINNYIYFNCSDYSNQSSSTCETWRIIGVFDGKVKIMRGSQIGEYSWDSSASDVNSGFGVNEWSQADLMKLLNSGYDSESVGGSLYWNAKSGTCYTRTSTTSCNFTSTGLKNDTTRNMIAETTYYTRGHNDYEIYVDAMYDKERVSGTVITGVTPTRTLTWTGKVAIPYPSDYGYAADLSLCQQQLANYPDTTCTANNWMKNIITNNGADSGWLLTPYSGGAKSAWHVASPGNVNDGSIEFGNTNNSYRVVPVLFLTSELGIGSGTGTSSSPYQLSV